MTVHYLFVVLWYCHECILFHEEGVVVHESTCILLTHGKEFGKEITWVIP